MTIPLTDALAVGTHAFDIDGVTQRYHVHGKGPVCVAHSGGPGVTWEYLRMPALEEHLTVVYPEPVGTVGSGRLHSHPHGYTRALYSRFLQALIDHLGVPEVYVLGHSHGGFVAQYHALHHPEKIAGVILYESAPVTGQEHVAEAVSQVQRFVERHGGHPELPAVLAAFDALPGLSDDAGTTDVLKALVPVYFADYWGREEEFAPFRAAVGATYISSLDQDQVPHSISATPARPARSSSRWSPARRSASARRPPRPAVYAADAITQVGLTSCLERRPNLEPAAMEEADVVVVAVATADATTLDTLRDLLAPERARFVLVVGGGWYIDPSAAVACGVRAVLWRAEANPTALVRTVVSVANGQAWLPPTVQGQLLDQVEHVQREVPRPRGLTASGLTAREIDVLRLVSEGMDLSEIAQKMSYSERTIKKVVSSVMGRLGLRNRVHAVSYAIRAGLI